MKIKHLVLGLLLIALVGGVYAASTDYKVLNDGTVFGWTFVSKSNPADIRAYMDGLSGRPTYATWYANQTTTDVTDVIHAAIAAVSYGGIIRFPTGIFMVSTVTLTGEKDYIGAGIENTIIKQIGGTDADMITTNVAFNAYIKIQDMTLDGNRATQASGKVLNLVTTIFTKLERVMVREGKDFGVWADRCNVLRITDCNLYYSGINFFFKDAGGSGSFKIDGTGLQAGDICQAKIELSESTSGKGVITGSWFESSGVETPSDQLILNNASYMTIIGNRFAGPGSTNSIINLKSGSKYNMIIGNTFVNAPSSVGVLIDSGAKHNISIGNKGGSPTDNDGENWILEHVNDYSMLQTGRTVLKWVALADSATPSVLKGNFFVTNGNTSPVTDYTDGQNGQEITICFRHNITVNYNASYIILNGSSNQAFAPGDTLTLFRDANLWKEKGRCVQ